MSELFRVDRKALSTTTRQNTYTREFEQFGSHVWQMVGKR
jgi:hypothetical protein